MSQTARYPLPPALLTTYERRAQTPAGGPGRAVDLLPAAYPPAPTPARQIVVDFLVGRLTANNARIAFLLDNTPENMTAWVNAENAIAGDTDI